MSTEEIKKALLTKRKKKSPLLAKDFISSGSTLVNLAVSGKPNCAFSKGKYYLLIGDSEAGKSWLSLNALAEASINKEFDNYRLIYNNVEDGALMDLEYFFGKKLASRLEIKKPQTVEEFYFALDDHVQEGKPFIEVLDSMDALDAEADEEKFQKLKKANRKGKDESGSYGTAKAKANSLGMRVARNGLQKTNSILLVISQTRDKIGSFGYGPKKTRSGGHALKFYNTAELWFSVKESIKRNIKGKNREVGNTLHIQVKKDRQTGRHPAVDINFYPDVGIDDIGSMVAYLIEEGKWKGTEATVNAVDFDFSGKREDLIKYIETNDLEADLKSLVTEIWIEIESLCSVYRKRRY